MNNMDKLKVLNVNRLKKIKIVNSNKIIDSKINNWMDNGINLIGGIIDSIYELGCSITFMDFDVGDLSFMCLDKNNNRLFIKLNNKDYYPNKENKSSIMVTNGDVSVEYLCSCDRENIYLILNKVIKEKNSHKTKVLNKKN